MLKKVVGKLIEAKPSVELVLQLTTHEAEDILRLTQRIGGAAETTTRGVFDEISAELTRLGIEDVSTRMSGTGVTFLHF